MANIPDEAVLRAHEINPQAFRLYAYYCMRRNKDTGVCFPSLKKTAEDTNISYTYCSEMRTHLLKSGWIKVVGNEVKPLIGFEKLSVLSVNIVKKFGISEELNALKSSEKANNSSGIPKISSLKSSDIPNIVSDIPNIVSDIPNIVSDIPNIKFGNSEIPYIEPPQLTTPINHKEQSRKVASKKPEYIPELPDWLPQETWSRWTQYRKEIKKPLVPSTVAAQITALGKFHDDGQEPDEVIQQSIEHGWQGLFALKNQGAQNGTHRQNGNVPSLSAKDQRSVANNRAADELERELLRKAGVIPS